MKLSELIRDAQAHLVMYGDLEIVGYFDTHPEIGTDIPITNVEYNTDSEPVILIQFEEEHN